MSFPATQISLLERLRSPERQDDYQAAWTEFFEAYYSPMVGTVRMLTRTYGLDLDTEADDIATEVMITMVRRFQSFTYNPEKGRLRNFLITSLRRRMFHHHRRRNRRRENSLEHPGRTDEGQRAAEEIPDASSPTPDVEMDHRILEHLMAEIRTKAIRHAARNHSARDIGIYLARTEEEATSQEIAARWDVTVNLVDVVRHRVNRTVDTEQRRLTQGILDIT